MTEPRQGPPDAALRDQGPAAFEVLYDSSDENVHTAAAAPGAWKLAASSSWAERSLEKAEFDSKTLLFVRPEQRGLRCSGLKMWIWIWGFYLR